MGQNPRKLAREESAIQQPEGLEGSGRFGCILDKHGLWLAAGIFLRIRVGVDRPRKKTKLIKCAAATGATGARPGPAQPQG